MARVPAALLGGRLRTSTLALVLFFVGVLVSYVLVRPPPATTSGSGSTGQAPSEQQTPAPSRSATPSVSPTVKPSETPTGSSSPSRTPSAGAPTPHPTHSPTVLLPLP